MPSVILNGQTLRLQAGQLIGKGGEADVFKIDPTTVLKLYKRPNDPDYMGNNGAQQGAVERIREHQQKLPAFPKNLPVEVVAPQALAYNKAGGEVVGYTMSFVRDMEVLMRLGDRQYRETSGIDGNHVIATFRRLHEVLRGIHRATVVVGDMNDLNILFNQQDIRVVDADSMQFGTFKSHTFTSRFVDPLLCERDRLVLARPHNQESDWYAYFTMLLQSLLYVGPYGGVHRPKSGKRLQHDARVLGRVTVMDDEVIYPKPALPLGVLPDELLGYMREVYEKDAREVFPEKYLDDLRWTNCTQCGLAHARATCPNCATSAGRVKTVITIHGTVTTERIFQTIGKLLHVTSQNGELQYLYHEDGVFYREGRKAILSAELNPNLRYRLKRSSTLIGKAQSVFEIGSDGKEVTRFTTDIYRNTLPVFDANSHNSFWLEGNQLMRDGKYGPVRLGATIPQQTLFWVGEQRGFGFFQAGKLLQAFLFNTDGSNFNDQVEIPSFSGQLIDATCVFATDYTWLLVTLQEQGTIVHKAYAINSRGDVIGEATAPDGEDSWLGGGIRGNLAFGASLMVATDDGIVRVGVDGGKIVLEKEFPDTEPFVNTHSQLVQGRDGIYTVTHNREITLLKIK